MEWFFRLSCMYDFISKYIYLLCQEKAYSDALTEPKVKHVHLHPLFPITQCSNIWTFSLGGFWLLQSLFLQPHLYCQDAQTWKIRRVRGGKEPCFPLQSSEQPIPGPLLRVTFGFSLQLIQFATQALLLALVTGTLDFSHHVISHLIWESQISQNPPQTSCVCRNYVTFPRKC